MSVLVLKKEKIEIRLDKVDGPIVGSVSVSPIGGMDIYKLMSCRIKEAKECTTFILLFKGERRKAFNLDYWSLSNIK